MTDILLGSLIPAIPVLCLFCYEVYKQLFKSKPPPDDPPLTPSQLLAIKQISRPPPVDRPSRPGWFGRKTANERLLESIGKGFSETIKAANPTIPLTPKEKIRLARQAFAQDAITIEELERVIDNAIKEGA